MSTSTSCYNKPASGNNNKAPQDNVTLASEDKGSQGHSIIHGFFPNNKMVTNHGFYPKDNDITLDSDKTQENSWVWIRQKFRGFQNISLNRIYLLI